MFGEKINVVLPPKSESEAAHEIIIRQVNSVNELEVKAPIKTLIVGTIGAPVEFLRRRVKTDTQCFVARTHALVCREKLSITLVTDEDNEYRRGEVKGLLSNHPKFIEFGINTGKPWQHTDLGQFCKMNRAFFVDRTENMSLVAALMGFKAKVESAYEREAKENGSRTDNYSQIVNSNLPGTFRLNLPLFKGQPKEEVEVEIYASVNGRDVTLQLFSPGANQALEDIRDTIIDEQIAAIREIMPDCVIIEQ